jgi:[protein-PII] uridylyltransferase
MERSEHIQKVRQEAVKLTGELSAEITGLWDTLGDDFFLRHSPEQVVHHTRLLLKNAGVDTLVDVQPLTERGVTEIFIFTPVMTGIFSRITAVLDQLGLNVVDASVFTTVDDRALDTFQVLEESGSPITSEQRLEEIQSTLLETISNRPLSSWKISRRPPRQYQHFPLKTHLDFTLDSLDQRTVMEITTTDRPGLLSSIGRAFSDCDIKLLSAKIVTLGSRAEDVYYITDQHDQPLTDTAQIECLEKAIHKYLDTDDRPT